MSSFDEIFNKLGAIDVSPEVKTLTKKDNNGKNLKYLSWAKMVEILNKEYPSWSYRIVEFDNEGKELCADEHGFVYQRLMTDSIVLKDNLPLLNTVTGEPIYVRKCVGYNVKTEITIEGETRSMWLYVMDSHMKPVKDKPYNVATRNGSYTVEQFSADLLNKSILRCLVKNAAIFGLGLNLYNGEDLPVVDDEEIIEESTSTPKFEAKPIAKATPTATVKPMEAFKPTATASSKVEPVAKPTTVTEPKPIAKVNASAPVAKIATISDTVLMDLKDALNTTVGTKVGEKTLQFYLDGGGKGWTDAQIKSAKARLVSFASRQDQLGRASATILKALEEGKIDFKHA